MLYYNQFTKIYKSGENMHAKKRKVKILKFLGIALNKGIVQIMRN